jgi:hypothetical protein
MKRSAIKVADFSRDRDDIEARLVPYGTHSDHGPRLTYAGDPSTAEIRDDWETMDALEWVALEMKFGSH